MNPPFDHGEPEDGDLVEQENGSEVPSEVKEAVRTLIRWAGLVEPATLVALNDHAVALAHRQRVTRGRKLRTDGTVVRYRESNDAEDTGTVANREESR